MFNKLKKEEKETARVNARPCGNEKDAPIALNYNLTFDELTDALVMLVDKRSPKSRKIMSAVLFLIAVICVVLYAMQPYGVHFAFGAIVFGVMTFLVLGYPTLKARSSAKQISKKQGIYKIVLTPDGYIKPYGDEKIDLWADAQSRTYESDTVFALRADRLHSFCIPKRTLNEKQMVQIRTLFQTYTGTYVDRCRK